VSNAEIAAAYRGVRDRVCELVAIVPSEQLEWMTPATPEWRVHDVVAHLTGVTADIVNGNLDGVATDAWTAAHVDARRDIPIAEVLTEWKEHGERVEAMVNAFPPDPARQLVLDAATHEQDIRGALGAPGARDSDAVAIGAEWGLGFVGAALDAADAGALAVEVGDNLRVLGTGDPTATLRADHFELLRVMVGRRSLEQIRALDWEGDARSELLVLGLFTPRPTPLHE